MKLTDAMDLPLVDNDRVMEYEKEETWLKKPVIYTVPKESALLYKFLLWIFLNPRDSLIWIENLGWYPKVRNILCIYSTLKVTRM